MGADLYIKKLYDPNSQKYEPLFKKWVELRDAAADPKLKEKYQKKVEFYYGKIYEKGYFRDSYNGTNVLNRLGLSWWNDFAKYLDMKGGPDHCDAMSPAKAKEFLALIESLPVQEVTAKELKEMHCKVDNGKNSVEAWNQGFHEQKKELIDFLKTAIKLNAPIEASI